MCDEGVEFGERTCIKEPREAFPCGELPPLVLGFDALIAATSAGGRLAVVTETALGQRKVSIRSLSWGLFHVAPLPRL